MMNWIDTALRKGTKNPKICMDMFIADSRGYLFLCTVKNGRKKSKEEISNITLSKLVDEYSLIERESGIFSGCSTYRTENGWRVIDKALAEERALKIAQAKNLTME